ncbi:MAG TPA: DUF3631 domain-containing protein [Candidatus Saccharimonadales bacterium]|nr:DUF3631 domain-containing protein [Candidatus Saccharimonadales bacterium]
MPTDDLIAETLFGTPRVGGASSAGPRAIAEMTGAPIDGEPHLAQLLEQVRVFLSKYVVFANSSQPLAVTLWVVHTYLIDQSEYSPYLAITSAEKRSGKTRLLDVLELLVKNPWRAVTPSEAVIYRQIAVKHPTLLLDETDAIFGGKTAAQHEGLRALLNAGNRPGTTVPRCVGEGSKMHVQDFEVYGAKALAGIGRLPDTVTDRSIPIRIQRRLKLETVEKFRYKLASLEAEPIKDALARLAEQLDLSGARPTVPDALNDRASDGWEPLLAIAEAGGGTWPERSRRAAVVLSAGADADEQSLGIKLLEDMRGIFDGRATDRLFTSALLEALRGLDESPWGELAAGSLTAHRLSRLLKPYGVEPHTVRVGADTAKGYGRRVLEPAWDRWLDPPAQPLTETP